MSLGTITTSICHCMVISYRNQPWRIDWSFIFAFNYCEILNDFWFQQVIKFTSTSAVTPRSQQQLHGVNDINQKRPVQQTNTPHQNGGLQESISVNPIRTIQQANTDLKRTVQQANTDLKRSVQHANTLQMLRTGKPMSEVQKRSYISVVQRKPCLCTGEYSTGYC